ncbi:MAG: glycoside hydrolase family 28 protein [Alistipes sp.]|nr:glycoside hydrolase family 28 protein [Alistipes sp.]MBQ1940243.1 glycoside hydrolase family 28 protein [Alistipes sp.]
MNFKHTLLFLAAAAMTACCCSEGDKYASVYENIPFEMPQVVQPSIPAREVCITEFGAVGDGMTLNTEAFAKAIDGLAEQGGGRVNVPDGIWFTGPIVLKDNIELHLSNHAMILFSPDQSLYPLTEIIFEGLNTWRLQSPISARGVKNVAITGGGVIDGSGDAWRMVKQSKVTESAWKKLVASGGIVDGTNWFPTESYYRGQKSATDQNVNENMTKKEDFEPIRDFLRPVLVAIHNCENVLLQGVTFQNSPCWTIHPAICTNLTIDGITVRCPAYAQNGDGVDIESCKNVLMINSSVDAGDDAICIKSGKNEDGRKRGIPCENVLVDNCIVFHGHGGFVVGSEMSGGVKNVNVRNCTFSGTDVGLRFKSTRGRGGVVENIFIENITMNNIVTDGLLFDLFYGGKSASEALADGDEGEATDMPFKPVDETTPAFRNIDIRDVRCNGARRAMLFNGLPEMNVENVKVENAWFYTTTGAQVNESTNVAFKNVTIVPKQGVPLAINNAKNVVTENFICPEGLTTALTVSGSRNENIAIGSPQITAENAQLSPKSVGKVAIN